MWSLAIYYWFLDVRSSFFSVLKWLFISVSLMLSVQVSLCKSYCTCTTHTAGGNRKATLLPGTHKPQKRKRMWLSWEHYDNLGTETRTHTHIHNNLLIFQLQIKFSTFLNQTKTSPSDYRFNLEQQQCTGWFGLIGRNIPCFIYTHTHTHARQQCTHIHKQVHRQLECESNTATCWQNAGVFSQQVKWSQT